MHNTAPTSHTPKPTPSLPDDTKRRLSLSGMVAMMSNNIITDINATKTISEISADASSAIAAFSEKVVKDEEDFYNQDIKSHEKDKDFTNKLAQYTTEYQQHILPLTNAQQQLQGVQTMWSNAMQNSSTGMSTVTQAITAALNNLFDVSQISVQ